ncbi:hypothetical protein QAD02_003603 [Eretmocerus hayati]|uniref:Uncharacterized protein n=1 Tax=Eretmocerus hayati TaxID=131215 RepID=A0ACC2NMN2_9HYME|nr:hypothetical protein QAD02_003603 [Eretmocerus hayati]
MPVHLGDGDDSPCPQCTQIVPLGTHGEHIGGECLSIHIDHLVHEKSVQREYAMKLKVPNAGRWATLRICRVALSKDKYSLVSVPEASKPNHKKHEELRIINRHDALAETSKISSISTEAFLVSIAHHHSENKEPTLHAEKIQQESDNNKPKVSGFIIGYLNFCLASYVCRYRCVSSVVEVGV